MSSTIQSKMYELISAYKFHNMPITYIAIIIIELQLRLIILEV